MGKNRITLICTSLNPDKELFDNMLKSAKGFDEIILHTDKDCIINLHHYDDEGWDTPAHLTIPDAYNLIIRDFVETEWVCCFCDDDYFYEHDLKLMIEEVHKGIDADVAHFKFRISGHTPPEDMRCWIGKKEYDLCEKRAITPKLLLKHNRLPAGSFFRKSAWKKVGGFQGEKFHDWDLWKRMAENDCKFKYFDYLVYNFVRRENSAWIRQARS